MRHFILIIGLCFLHFYSLGQNIDRLNKKELKNLITLLKYSRDSISSLKLKSDENILNLKSEINKISQQTEFLTSIIKENKEKNNKLNTTIVKYSDSIIVLNQKLLFKDSINNLSDSINELKRSNEYFKIFDNIQNERNIYTGKDSIRIMPFEMFAIMTFENIAGYLHPLIFKIENADHIFEFLGNRNEYKINHSILDDNANCLECIVTLELETRGQILKRKLVKGKKYQVIFSFSSDSRFLRDIHASEDDSTYYIVDIVEVNEKFTSKRYKLIH
jgi:hypothetical protein